MYYKKVKLFLIFIFINVIFIFFYDFFSIKIGGNEMSQYKKLYNNNLVVNNVEDVDKLSEFKIQNNLDYTPKISTIVIVFNNELNLNQCLDTVINQTLKEIEIICIDISSNVNVLEILIKYSINDRRITVIKKDNLNYNVAHNVGLSIAKGEYINFLDSDELLELNMFEEMYKKIKSNNADIYNIIICQSKSTTVIP